MSNHKHKSRTIKHIEQQAKKGDLLAIHTLANSYSTGKYLEKIDLNKAEHYLKELANALISAPFLLQSLELNEFRRFKKLTVEFDQQLTVFIGNNGAGKTSIIDSICKVLSWFTNNLIRQDVNGKRINELDIHVDCDEFSSIISKFTLGDKTKIEVNLGTSVSGYANKITNQGPQARQTGQIYRTVANQIMLPIFACYTVERANVAISKSVKENPLIPTRNNRFNVYKDSLEASAHLQSFSDDYVKLANLATGETSKEITELEHTIEVLSSAIAIINTDKKSSVSDALLIEREQALQSLAALKSTLPTQHQQQLSTINQTIERFLPEVKNLRIDRNKDGQTRILADNFGNEINITQLSQGQKSLLALVGDLALRLIKLNPLSDEPLNANGIVLIDEIELHLHPQWQQQILKSLTERFPKIQFIVTTHSPQVLSTVDKSSIRQLCSDHHSQPIIVIPSYQTQGVTSASILAQLMETHAIPQDIPQAIWVREFTQFIAEGNITKADQHLIKISKHFGENHPVTLDCQEQLKVYQLKQKYLIQGSK